MRNYLVVANRTLGSRQLIELAREAITAGPCSFHIVVPVTEEATDPTRAAGQRLAAQIAQLAETGAQATGEIVHTDPYDAALAAITRHEVDELVVCTLPPGLSRWLGADLVDRLSRVVDQPITHIVVPAGVPGRVHAQAVRVTVHIGESDHHGHTPLHAEIVQRARAAGLAGATVLRGTEGFGASSVIHTSRLLTLSEDLPVVVVLIDTAEHIDRFLPELDELVGTGLVVRETVDVIKYEGRRS